MILDPRCNYEHIFYTICNTGSISNASKHWCACTPCPGQRMTGNHSNHLHRIIMQLRCHRPNLGLDIIVQAQIGSVTTQLHDDSVEVVREVTPGHVYVIICLRDKDKLSRRPPGVTSRTTSIESSCNCKMITGHHVACAFSTLPLAFGSGSGPSSGMSWYSRSMDLSYWEFE